MTLYPLKVNVGHTIAETVLYTILILEVKK